MKTAEMHKLPSCCAGYRWAGMACLSIGFGLMAVGAGAQASAPASPNAPGAPIAPGQPTRAGSTDKAGVRAVRLSVVDGQVKVLQDGQVIADPAYANLPILEGAQVITGQDGRAEIQMENGSVARLSPNSTMTFTKLRNEGSGTKTEMQVNGGLAYFEMEPSTPEDRLEVKYGTATFSANDFTVARVTEDTPPGELSIFSGNVHVQRGDALELELHDGQTLTLDPKDNGQYNLADAIEQDSWDQWNDDRDQALNAQLAEKTAATESYGEHEPVGMSDLDANGNWYNVPGQGYVWSPYDAENQGQNFDPYGYGNWTYYPTQGYVFVSGYGWGYTPYQCGLWNYYDSFGWGWAPGNGCGGLYGAGFFGGGYGGWGFNIGNYPRWYRLPHRPTPGPIRPRPAGGGGGARFASIPVDRRPNGGVVAGNGAGNGYRGSGPGGAKPVQIGGQAVAPLRPLAPRSVYGAEGGRLAYGSPGGTGHTNVIVGGPRAGYGYTGGRTVGGYAPGTIQGHSGGFSNPGSRPSSPAPVARSAPSAPAPSHASSGGGGGGGGGGHAGGGGGGGSHK